MGNKYSQSPSTFVLESAVVKEIMRWDMGVLRESPWYQEILREGEARGVVIGEARGVAIGEARGRKEQMLSNIEMSLEAKFGSQGLELIPRIRQVNDLEQLKGILRTIITANIIDDLQEIM